MGIKLYKRPRCKHPDMIVAWPGIGNIGIVAIDTLRKLLGAEEVGEIEPFEFFYPTRVSIKGAVMEEMEFPTNKFYFKRWNGRDFIFFVGEEQTMGKGTGYAEGEKAYRLARLVLAVGQESGCRRIYTSGAAVASIHHSMKPRVWVVPNYENLLKEVREYGDAVIMKEGFISGLNGLLLGVAKEEGIEGICVMGEIPAYIAHFPLNYPKASKSVLEFFSRALELSVDLRCFDDYIKKVDEQIEEVYRRLPLEIREQLEKLKDKGDHAPREQKPIGDREEKEFIEKIGKLFEDIDAQLKREGKEND